MDLDRECDWVIKHKLIEGYRAKHDLPLTHPKVALIDLQYHDISRQRGLFYKLQDAGLVERTCTDADIDEAVETPPQTTRARLRGEFIRRAKERNSSIYFRQFVFKSITAFMEIFRSIFTKPEVVGIFEFTFFI